MRKCPFCSSEMEAYGRSDETWIIRCKNIKCYFCDGTDWWDDTKEEAIKRWENAFVRGDK